MDKTDKCATKDEGAASFVDFKVSHEVTVKWFNPEKGYGFVSLNGYRRDIFIHATVIKRAKLDTLTPGDKLIVMIGPGKDRGNKMIVDILEASEGQIDVRHHTILADPSVASSIDNSCSRSLSLAEAV